MPPRQGSAEKRGGKEESHLPERTMRRGRQFLMPYPPALMCRSLSRAPKDTTRLLN